MRTERWLLATVCLMGLLASTAVGGGWTDVRDYFPEGWAEDELDVREYVQQAFDENAKVYFPGSNDVDEPLRYHISPTVEVPDHAHVKFGPHHRVVRVPARGRLFELGDHVHFSGAVIDGNKYAHWPEFEEMGKQTDSAVRMGSHCVVKDSVVYNNPGHAFESWADYNKLYRCRAENVGYIDVKHGDMYYSSARDSVSADGFYFRGEGNLIKDCESYDAQRWDFCSSHSGAKQNTYVDCRGGDVEFRTYGFIDIEDADDNNRLIRCISPNSHIAIPISARTEVIQCMATRITAWDREASIDRYEDDAGVRNHGLLIEGNITTEGGIVIGGWSSRRDELVPGAASPIVINNRMYKSHAGPSDGYSDFSFSIQAADGHGVVANNILFEYDDGYTRGPGMALEDVEGHNNQVVYGQWGLDLPEPSLEFGFYDHQHIRERAEARGQEVLDAYLAEAEREGAPGDVRWLSMTASFIKDEAGEGEQRTWTQGLPEEAEAQELPITQHWDFSIGRYHGTGWYYLDMEVPAEWNGGKVHLFFSGIDSEARVFVDGQLVGEHEGWDEPSMHELEGLVEPGQRHVLAVKVSTHTGLGGLYGPVALVLDH